MNMDVVDALTAVLPFIGDQTIPVFQPEAVCNTRQFRQTSTEKVRIIQCDLSHVGIVSLWQEQIVDLRLRVDILNNQHIVVFVDLRRGNLSLDNFTEQTVHKSYLLESVIVFLRGKTADLPRLVRIYANVILRVTAIILSFFFLCEDFLFDANIFGEIFVD